MNLAEMMRAAGGGGAVNDIAARFGLPPEQARRAVEALLPAFQTGLQRHAMDPAGLGALFGALQPGHASAFERPGAAADPGVARAGDLALERMFGSKEVSKAVADHAATATGLGSAVLRQMLPIVAATLMGGLMRNLGGAAQGPGGGAVPGGASGGLGSLLEGMMRGGTGAGGFGGGMPGGMGAPMGGGTGGGMGGLGPLGGILGGVFGGAPGTTAGGGLAPQPQPGGGADPAPGPAGDPFGGLGGVLGQVLGGMTGGMGGGGMAGGFGGARPDPRGEAAEVGGYGGPSRGEPAPEPAAPAGAGSDAYRAGLDALGRMFDAGREVQDRFGQAHQGAVQDIFERLAPRR